MREEYKEKIYSEFLSTRDIIYNEDVSENLLELLTMQIIRVNREDDKKEKELSNYKREDNPIKIWIHTRGGYVKDCLSAASSILTSKTPVYTYAMGWAASAGFIILVAGHKRFCQIHSRMMYHALSGWNCGSLADMAEEFNELAAQQKVLDKIVTDRTKIDQDTLNNINMMKHDWWLDAKMAKKLGVIHSTI